MKVQFFNGKSVISTTGENCTTEFCSPYIRIFVNNKLDYTSAVQDKTTTPQFKFTYISQYIPKDSRIQIELWSFYMPIEVASISPDDRLFMFPENKYFHYMKSISDPERCEMYKFMTPLGIDGISGRNFKKIKRKYRNKKFVVAYDDDQLERLVYKSTLLSFWTFSSIREFEKINRLNGRLWENRKQNLLFFNVTWKQNHQQHSMKNITQAKKLDDIVEEKNITRAEKSYDIVEVIDQPEKQDHILEKLVTYTKALADRHIFRHTSQKIVEYVQTYNPNLHHNTSKV